MNAIKLNPSEIITTLKTLITVFILAFIFNFIWENLHANLYVHYQGGVITEQILLRATLFDAGFITLMSLLFIGSKYFNQRLWLAMIIGLLFAIGLERWALETNRWSYNELMPIIPLIRVGLTPTLQLGFLAFLIFKITKIETK